MSCATFDMHRHIHYASCNVIACLIRIKQLSTGIVVNLNDVDGHCENVCFFSTSKIGTFGNSTFKQRIRLKNNKAPNILFRFVIQNRYPTLVDFRRRYNYIDFVVVMSM